MKCRNYIAYAIDDPSNIKREAIIVFESLAPNGLDERKIKSSMKHQKKEISLFIDFFKPFEPSLEISKKGGF